MKLHFSFRENTIFFEILTLLVIVQKVILRKCEKEIFISTLTLMMAFKLSSAQPMEHKKYSAGILSRKHFTQGNKI